MAAATRRTRRILWTEATVYIPRVATPALAHYQEQVEVPGIPSLFFSHQLRLEVQGNSASCSKMRVLGAIALCGASLQPCIASSNASAWQQIAIGGGGYVLQTFFSPVDANVYMKTDVGGIYRRSPTNDSWIPLLDWAGPDSEALDPRCRHCSTVSTPPTSFQTRTSTRFLLWLSTLLTARGSLP